MTFPDENLSHPRHRFLTMRTRRVNQTPNRNGNQPDTKVTTANTPQARSVQHTAPTVGHWDSASVYADPVTYLAQFGIEATVVAEDRIPLAA